VADNQSGFTDRPSSRLLRVVMKNGQVTTIARNGETDGAAGELDRPSEVCLRGNLLYVSNIDLPYGGNEYDRYHNLSVFELDD
jgi:hypothetical protein